jgi:hypothetical protein
MSSNDFNEAFRRALRPDPLPEEQAPPPLSPRRRQSVDAGAGTTGPRTPMSRPSMNDLIRGASRDSQ